ncbi:MFS transporter [Natrinema versiforme]|uniref:MFS transporter n=1 Tax=Natrinema versiforme TaxID=88724 RepID=UPI002D21E826|nr:MFS transporter [Natrinema versiforme]
MAVGFKTGQMNLKRLLLIGAIGTAVSTFLVSQAFSFPILLVLLFFQGATAGIFRAIDRPVLSHLFPVNRGEVFNTYTAVWAIGAASEPIFVNGMLSIGDWRIAYLVLAVAFIAPFALLISMDRPDQLDNEERLSLTSLWDVLKRPAVFSMALGLMASGAIEGVIFTWLPYYATRHFPTATANLLLSVHLASYIPGRMLSGYLAGRVRYLLLLFVLVGSTIPAYAAFLLTTGRVMVASVAVVGFLMAGVFPTLFAFGVESTPEYSGPVNAIATAVNFAGISISPPPRGDPRQYFRNRDRHVASAPVVGGTARRDSRCDPFQRRKSHLKRPGMMTG